MAIEIIHADNALVLPAWPDASFDLIYIDPPFNTGKVQRRVLRLQEEERARQRAGG